MMELSVKTCLQKISRLADEFEASACKVFHYPLMFAAVVLLLRKVVANRIVTWTPRLQVASKLFTLKSAMFLSELKWNVLVYFAKQREHGCIQQLMYWFGAFNWVVKILGFTWQFDKSWSVFRWNQIGHFRVACCCHVYSADLLTVVWSYIARNMLVVLGTFRRALWFK